MHVPPLPPESRGGSRRWLWLTAGVVALGFVFRAALPTATALIIEREGSKALGLMVTVENVDYEIFLGRVALEGVRVAAHEAADEPLLTWRRLVVDFEWLRLLSKELALASVVLQGPTVALLQDAEGRLVIPIASPSKEAGGETAPVGVAAPEQREEAGAGWPVAIDACEISDVRLHVRVEADQSDSLVFALQRFGVGDLRIDGKRMGLGSIVLDTPSIRFRTDRVPTGVTGPLFAARADGAAGDAPVEAEDPFGYRIAALHIDQARVSLAGSSEEPLEIDLKLSAEDVAMEPAHRFPTHLRLGIDGGWLEFSGRTGLVPPAFAGTLRWSDLPLPTLLGPTDLPIAAWLRSGSSEGALEIATQFGATVDAEASPRVRLSGTMGVADLDFAEPEAAVPRLAWSGLAIEAREVVLPSGAAPLQVDLLSLELESPRVAWIRPADQLNALFAEQPPQAEAGEQEVAASGDSPTDSALPVPSQGGDASQPQIKIARLRLHDGEFSIDDRVVEPPFSDKISELELSGEDFQLSPRSVHRLRAKGRSLGGGPFTLSGDVDPGASEAHLHLVREALPDYDAYARNYAGYRIGRGALSVDLQLKEQGETTLADTEITLHDLRVSPQGDDTFGQIFGVPIGLALALLRDPKGEIRFKVPVQVSERGAETGIAPILYQSFRQAIVGALASPLKTLGFAFRGGGGEQALEDLRKSAFLPGTAQLSDEARTRAKKVAKLLAQRPELRVELRGAVGDSDRRPLAEQRLLGLRREEQDWPPVEGSGLFARQRIGAALEEREAGGKGELSEEDEALLMRLADAVEVTQEQRLALAGARAQSARSELVDKNGADPAQVGLISGLHESESGLEVELSVRLDDDQSLFVDELRIWAFEPQSFFLP